MTHPTVLDPAHDTYADALTDEEAANAAAALAAARQTPAQPSPLAPVLGRGTDVGGAR